MNIFRSLIGKVWHDPNAAEVVKISEGQLYLVREETIRSERECIYNDAMATIRRVPSLDHHFQLVITRVYEDGDQELLEDEDETDEERSFLISEELQYRTGQLEGEPTFIWRDLEGDVDEVYEFVATGTNGPTRAFFETCMYRAMYERKYKKSADDTTDAQLAEFIWQPQPKQKGKGKGKARSKAAAAASAQSPTDEQSVSASGPAPHDAPPQSPQSQPEPAPTHRPQQTPVITASTMPHLVSVPAELYLWNVHDNFYERQAEGVEIAARIVKPDNAGPYDYWLLAITPDGQYLAHRVSSDLNQRYIERMSAFIWNHVSDAGIQSSWCFRLSSEEDYLAYKAAFTKALWETNNQIPYEKIKPDEQAYIMSSNTEDVEMKDVEEDSDEEEAVEDELDEEESESEEESEEEEDELRETEQPQLPAGKNEMLTVGYKGDRSFVVRGNNIGVFSHKGGDEVDYVGTIKNVATPKGQIFKPSEIMLHEQDSKMVLMNPIAPHSLFNLDLEVGKVVEEWKVNDDIPVKHIAPESKFAQTTHERTLVGASSNALFRIDPRLSGEKLVDSQYKQYVSKNKFSGLATTASGKLAVASEKGDIRLFDTIGKNAKTALPPLGDPIIGIDATADGRWIVATTKTYLLLIDTLIGEGRYTGQLGFDRSFPANAKPIPRRLQLRTEHVAFMGHGVSFSPARFNMGEGKEENAIITSTGEFVIAWDFAKVKKGLLDRYEIKKYEDTVVQDNFKFGDDKEIIVAMTNNVVAVNKKALKRPTRVSLGVPGQKNPRSRSNIVNSPF